MVTQRVPSGGGACYQCISHFLSRPLFSFAAVRRDYQQRWDRPDRHGYHLAQTDHQNATKKESVPRDKSHHRNCGAIRLSLSGNGGFIALAEAGIPFITRDDILARALPSVGQGY